MITQPARHAPRRLLVTLSIGVAAIQVLATPAHGEELSLPPLIDRELFFGDPEISGVLTEHVGGRYQTDAAPEVADRMAVLQVDVSALEMPAVPEEGEWAKTAPLPVPDSSLLAPVTLGYRTRIAPAGGTEITTEGTQTLTKGELEGRPVWRITTVTQPPMGGQSTEVFELDMASRSPLRRSVTQGAVTVTLQFTDEAVTGTMAFRGQEKPVDVVLEAPVFGAEAALETTLGALPQKLGYRTTFRTFDLRARQVRVWSFEVTAVETVQVEAGVFETFKTELESLDGSGGRGTMWFASRSPRVVVRSVLEIRGATFTSELTSRK